jgi:hypothetical protein
VSFSEPLDDFLDPNSIGVVEAIYDGSRPVMGHFFNDPVETFSGPAVRGTSPMFRCKATDVAAEPSGKTLTIGGVGYTIVYAEPNGIAMVNLKLRAT